MATFCSSSRPVVLRERILLGVGMDVVGHEALQIADGNRLVDLAPLRPVLAEGCWHTRPQTDGKGATSRISRYASLNLAAATSLSNHERWYGRAAVHASGFAGPGPALAIAACRESLGVTGEDRFALRQSRIELTRQHHRAAVDAQPAAGAAALVHKARLPFSLTREVPGLPFYPFDVRSG